MKKQKLNQIIAVEKGIKSRTDQCDYRDVQSCAEAKFI